MSEPKVNQDKILGWVTEMAQTLNQITMREKLPPHAVYGVAISLTSEVYKSMIDSLLKQNIPYQVLEVLIKMCADMTEAQARNIDEDIRLCKMSSNIYEMFIRKKAQGKDEDIQKYAEEILKSLNADNYKEAIEKLNKMQDEKNGK